MRNIIAAITAIFALAFSITGALAQPAPPPDPWVNNGNSVAYLLGTVIVGAPSGTAVTGIGNENVSGGYYINGVPISTVVCGIGCAFTNVANIFTASPQIVQGLTTTSPGWYAQVTGDSYPRVRVGLNATDIASIAFGSGNATRDTFIERAGVGWLRLGAPDSATPQSQILSTQNVLAGTSNTGGVSLSISGSRGTGNAGGGALLFYTAPAGSSGSTQNPLALAMVIYGDGAVGIGGTSPTDLGAGSLYVKNNIDIDSGGLYSAGIAPTGTGVYVRATSPSLSGVTITGSFAATGLVTNADLVNSTISGISLGSNLATLTFGTYLTGTSYNGSGAITIATNATSANTASTIVARDSSGNFSANAITASSFYGGSSAGSTAQINGTSNGSPSGAYLNLQSNGQFASIGNTAPKTYLDVNENLSSSPALLVSTSLSRLQAVDGASSGFEVTSYVSSGGNIVSGGVAGGTSASPAGSPNNGYMFNMRGYGYNSGWQLGGQWAIVTSEAWSPGHQGTAQVWYTTPNATTSLTQSMQLTNSGTLVMGSPSGTTITGAGNINISGAFYANGVAVTGIGTMTSLTYATSGTGIGISGTNPCTGACTWTFSAPYTPPGTGAVATTTANELKRMVWAKDYGVVCDGSTDDGVALQYAWNQAAAAGVDLWLGGIGPVCKTFEQLYMPTPVATGLSGFGQARASMLRGPGGNQVTILSTVTGTQCAITIDSTYGGGAGYGLNSSLSGTMSGFGVTPVTIGGGYGICVNQITQLKFENVSVLGLARGFSVIDSILMGFEHIWVESNTIGFYGKKGTISDPNAWNINASHFSSNATFAVEIFAPTSVSITGKTDFESNGAPAGVNAITVYIPTVAGGAASQGLLIDHGYFEANHGSDVFIDGSSVNSSSIHTISNSNFARTHTDMSSVLVVANNSSTSYVQTLRLSGNSGLDAAGGSFNWIVPVSSATLSYIFDCSSQNLFTGGTVNSRCSGARISSGTVTSDANGVWIGLQ